MLSADELLAGADLTFELEVPATILTPGDWDGNGAAGRVRLRPLTVAELQLLTRAAKENDQLFATLMVQRALVEPEMTVAQVARMHVGLVEFLLHHVNRISGITATAEELETVAEEPLARAAFVLAREFGWTPQQIGELTLGQVLLHLKMLKEPPPA
jgi:hypothetical protein